MGQLIILDIWKARGAETVPLNSNLASVWLDSISSRSEPAASYLLEFEEGWGSVDVCARKLLWSSPFKEALEGLAQAGPSTMPLGAQAGIGAATAVLFACGDGPDASRYMRQRARASEEAIVELAALLDSGRFEGVKVLARLDASEAVLSENQGKRLARALALAEKAHLAENSCAGAAASKPKL